MTCRFPIPPLALLVFAGCEPIVLQADPPDVPEFCEAATFVEPERLVAAQVAACERGNAAMVGLKGFDNLQAAIDDAADDRTVFVCPGTHTGTIRLLNRRLALVGMEASDGALSVIRGRNGRVFDVETSVVSMHDLRVVGGQAANGGGLHASRSAVQLDGVVMRNHQSTELGAGIFADQSVLRLLDTQLSDNTALGSGGAVGLSEGCLYAERSTFTDNTAERHGGAVFYRGQPPSDIAVTIRDSRLVGNEAGERGGAVAMGGAEDRAEILIQESGLKTNMAGSDGGAVAIDGFGETRIAVRNSVFVENTSLGRGGAIASTGGIATLVSIDDTLFEANRSAGRGGGLYHQSRAVLDVVDVTDTTWLTNEAQAGTAISLSGAPAVLAVDGNRFSEPTRDAGSKIAIQHPHGPFEATDCTVDGKDGVLPIVSLCLVGEIPKGQDFRCDPSRSALLR